jgi:large subunit ribosomal protein L6
MSRIGRNPITVPAGVTVSVAGDVVTVKGPNATMTRNIPDGISLAQEGDTLVIDRRSDETTHKALHGLTRTLVSNMVTGVTEGWSKELEIIGVGYRAAASGPGAIDLALPPGEVHCP